MSLARVTGFLRSRFIRQTHSNAIVPLLRATENGSEDPIQEPDFYRYLRYRWLGDEAEKHAKRHRDFNLSALLAAAAETTGRGSIKLTKCVEGQFNKAFLLSMNTGEEVVARLPNPNAGPAFFTTASEVATRHFLRDFMGVPIPCSHAWSCETSNPVGAEYIIEEKAPGVPLGQLWNEMTTGSQLHIIKQIVDIESRFMSIRFPKHGCIYYRTDLEQRSQRYATLDEISFKFGLAQKSDTAMSCFVLGPSNHPKLWENQRSMMELGRGPWGNITEYATSMGRNEVEWARLYAKPRMNFHRSLEYPETPNDYISLLDRYLAITPYLTSGYNEQPNTISHPDLHLDNIFTDPETKQITSIIDWQRVSAYPALLHRSFPQMLEITRGEEDKHREHEKFLLDYHYKVIEETDPLRWEILSASNASAKANLISSVPCCWEQRDLFSLRNILIEAVANWEEITSSQEVSCPIGFTREELLKHQDEMELIEGISGVVHQLQSEGLIPLGGMVRREYYERAKKPSDHFKENSVGLAENEREKELHAKVWPYQ